MSSQVSENIVSIRRAKIKPLPDKSNEFATIQDSPVLRPMIPRVAIAHGRPYLFLKRLFDILIVLVFLLILLPITLVLMVALKVEDWRAPVFFFQERTGFGGRRFRMFKFRTMVVNAEELKLSLASQNELLWPDFKITNDPRITKVGRFLRKTSLDELPQLVNVLKGDMSLVGPRPTSFKPETYELWQSERLEVRPGLTGLWQIAGRGSLEFDQRVRLDISYIKNLSLALDLKILLFTIPAALKGS